MLNCCSTSQIDKYRSLIFRYYAVLKPLIVYENRGKIMITVAWTLSFLCSAPQVKWKSQFFLYIFICQTQTGDKSESSVTFFSLFNHFFSIKSVIFHVETHPIHRDFTQCVTFNVLSNTGAVSIPVFCIFKLKFSI